MFNLMAVVAPLVAAGGLVHLVLTLAVIGFIVWLITTYIPMPDIFKKVIYAVVAVCVILFVCNYFELF